MGGKGKAPPPVDPGQAQGEYLFGQDFESFQGVTDPRLQERIIAAEETFRPRFAALELKDIQTFAEGFEDPVTGEKTPGVFDLLVEQSRRAGELQREQLAQQREADIRALETFAPQAVEAFRAADPRSAALADAAQQQALGLFAEAEGPLSPERRRIAEQAARAGSLARGRIGDESSIAAELLGREQFRSGLRAEARQAGAGAFGQQRQIAGDLGAAILGRPSSAIQLGQQNLGQATGLAAQGIGPQLFDPNVGINMALQQRGQDIELMGANAAARGAIIGGLAQGLGALGGGMATGGTGLFASSSAGCWVAREVYGIENPKWLEFRYWMYNESPSWFRNLYIKYGERVAKFISNKPRIKSIIRKWMDTKIK